MTKILLFQFSNNSNVSLRLDLTGFEDSQPFPLNEPWYIQWIILVLMLATFCCGLKFRCLIIRYLISPECKGPINALVWADQINGFFLGLQIILKTVIMLNPVPLSEALGQRFCDWTSLLLNLYLAGSSAWSFSIAVFRVVIIKGTNLIGEVTLLKILFPLSFITHFLFAIVTAICDNKSAARKMCLHYSDAEIEYLDQYRVRRFLLTPIDLAPKENFC